MNSNQCPICEKTPTEFCECNVCHDCKLFVSSPSYDYAKLYAMTKQFIDKVDALRLEKRSELYLIDMKMDNKEPLTLHEEEIVNLLNQFNELKNLYRMAYLPDPSLKSFILTIDARKYFYYTLLLQSQNIIDKLQSLSLEEEK